jgi:hypothetical protein
VAPAPTAVVADSAAVRGVVAVETFQLHVVLTAKLKVPDWVKGFWPPPPRPVWLVTETGVPPRLVASSWNVPVVPGLWQSNFHARVHRDGSGMAAIALSPVPES